ncbi:MAG: hypothetical protein IT385_26580 [Deltaproteobacteria bacterium]|nr:hypothetical protein [Deltaproteobacteria bacterium]
MSASGAARAMMTLASALVVVAAPARARAAPDAAAARTLAAEAALAREAHEDAAAAASFEEADACDPHPLWLVAAGEAWLDAAEPERAAARLEAALTDARLPEGSRARVADLERSARALAPIVARARVATSQQRHAAAARAWGEALAIRATDRHRLERLRAIVRANDMAEAARLVAELGPGAGLARAERVELVELRARVEARAGLAAAPAPARSSAPAWLLVGGGALVIGGVVALAVAEGNRADVRDAMAEDPATRGMTRARALALRDDAETLDVVGGVGGGLGLALAGTGVLLGTVGGLGFSF